MFFLLDFVYRKTIFADKGQFLQNADTKLWTKKKIQILTKDYFKAFFCNYTDSLDSSGKNFLSAFLSRKIFSFRDEAFEELKEI